MKNTSSLREGRRMEKQRGEWEAGGRKAGLKGRETGDGEEEK